MSKKEMKEQGLSKEELDIMNNQRHGPGSKKGMSLKLTAETKKKARKQSEEHLTNRGRKMGITPNCSSETMQARRT